MTFRKAIQITIRRTRLISSLVSFVVVRILVLLISFVLNLNNIFFSFSVLLGDIYSGFTIQTKKNRESM